MKWLMCNDGDTLINIDNLNSIYRATAGTKYEPHYIIGTNQNIILETSLLSERNRIWSHILSYLCDDSMSPNTVVSIEDLEQLYG